MRLNRLELHGFKSFADRTILNFGGQHLLGIVGPNGCGKSNVVDAVRWVLGETRPTSMRGEGMTDVIFKGSASRAPMSLAEVTLVVDNSEGLLEEMGAEFAITRCLYKSGEGEYRIDGQRVRLKDVRELLYGTGLGSRGYSVLEQGRIDAVLSANPAQRRAVFEEAAGVSRYRQRRHETELRLKRVEQDVSRLDDVMGELRTRVRSLKIQAGKAERWVAARDEWTLERGRFLRHRVHELDGELASLFPELDALQSRQDALREERAEAEQEVRKQEEDRSRVVAELDAISTEVGTLSGALAALDERKVQLALRVKSWRASAAEESDRASQLEQQIRERLADQGQMEKDLAHLEEVVASADEEASGLLDRVGELSKTYKAARAEAGAQNERVLGCLHERTGAQNRVAHLETAIGSSRARLERATERVRRVEGALTGARERVQTLEEGQRTAQEGLAQRDEALAESQGQLKAATAELEQAGADLRERELERTGLVARIEALLEGDGDGSSLASGARRVLQSVAGGDGPCAAGTLRGLLADHLHVDVRLARALDAVLADRAHALVAPGAKVAREVLAWLQEQGAGQAGILVPTGLAVDSEQLPASTPLGTPLGEMTPPSFLAFKPYGASVEGRLSELVRCDDDVRPVVDALLGDVVVVSDLDTAFELVKREPAWRYVTPSGELVEISGVVGGSREVAQGTMGRRSMAEELAGERDTLDAYIEAAQGHVHELEQARDQSQSTCEESSAQRENARGKMEEATSGLHTARARLADQEAAGEEHTALEARAREDLASLEAELEDARLQRTSAIAAFEEANTRLVELEQERHSIETEREALAKDEARAQVQTTRLRGELDGLRARMEASVRRSGEDAGEQTRAQGRSENFLANADQAEREGEVLTVDGEELAQKRAALEARLEELRALEKTGAARTRQVRERAEEVQHILDTVTDEQSQKRLRAQRVELAREELLVRAGEDLGLEAADLREGFEPDPELAEAEAMETLEQRVNELKAILEKLGPVNTEAVDELEEVEGRLGFLETQSEDLATSRKTLADAIAKIDEESRRLFEQTFETVRGNFRRIFRLLFGGGQADVTLEEGVDVLEAGVEITARPPGRETLSIGLLSGGQRSMTALALLFAVFEAQPSPFCVLDEVDAALDDANIDRFLGMLSSFADTTQFIVVTHNKGTMSACQSLFGVTMEVKGVSRYVSVELDQVDAFVPGETKGRERRVDGGTKARRTGQAPDAESGEPVVELVPASAGGDALPEAESGGDVDAAKTLPGPVE